MLKVNLTFVYILKTSLFIKDFVGLNFNLQYTEVELL